MATVSTLLVEDDTNVQREVDTLKYLTECVATAAAAITLKGLAAAGTDGTNARILKTNTSGEPLIGSNAYTSSPTVTRPANTTAYTAGDVLGGVITFTSAGPSGGHLILDGADLRIKITAIPAGMTTFRLHLYDVTPPSAFADNAVWTMGATFGDVDGYLGYIDLGAPALQGTGSNFAVFVQVPDGLAKKVKLASASTSLFGYLVTNGGFTPAANSEVYLPRIGGIGV